MDSSDRIPSGEEPVGIPDHLRARLHAAAERKLREACDVAFPPDGRDAVVDAVHVIDALNNDNLDGEALRELVEIAVSLEAPLEVPRALADVAEVERRLATVRELLELAMRAGGGSENA